MRFLPLLALASLLTATASADPVWIWDKKGAKGREAVSFKKTFDVAGPVKAASLLFTCDNGAVARLNGKAVAENPDWQQPTKADLAKHLKPGANEIIFDATNKGGSAAFIAKIEIETADGKKSLIESSGEWLARPTGEKDAEWKPAVVLAKYGDKPWGKALDGNPGSSEPLAATPAKDVTVPEGFSVELLYTVPKADQGSWVALTVDHKGRLIACDQYGSLYRMAVPAIGKTEELKPEKLSTPMGKAHGLLHAFDSLYVMVNEDGANNGLYRLQDTDGDDQYDKSERLVEMKGGGEHGLHSMTVSPDGKRIYFNGGNHTELPTRLDASRPAKIWDEDHILPRMWDANGHARGRMAPGGFVCSMDPDGKNVELFCSGFRNEFDIAFDAHGELYTYDADMEWDIGAPWYRPTRVNHCLSGGEYGWRSGSGKWPGYYPDNLPATIDIGPGSPT
ncbi:MAG TPA: heme-binding protein, partial [Prosthecobacter sp.]|nr:heme-binding protein [Prosthecobacter sp.]